MKYFLTLIGVAAFVTIFLTVTNISEHFFFSFNNGNTIEGNGNLSENTRNLAQFEKIYSKNSIKVQLIKGANCKVVVKADSNLLELIKTKVSNKKLHIYMAKNTRTHTPINVFVTFSKISELQASSASDIICESYIKEDSLKLTANSAGSINLSNVEIENLEAYTSSTGTISLSGKCKELNIESSSASSVLSSNLKSKNCNAYASSASSIDICTTGYLKAKATSAGQITYSGQPENIQISKSSAGSIHAKD